MCRDKSLLRTEYETKPFPIAPAGDGIFRYRQWLPARREIPGSSRPTVYRSRGLAKVLGLHDLWIAFSGYWPERDCCMLSGTFKELEAYTVVSRTRQDAGVMVLASAGNTAAAFAAINWGDAFRCVLVVPDHALPRLSALGHLSGHIKVVALKNGTYNDAIAFAGKITAAGPEFFPEGGVRNVARRDGPEGYAKLSLKK